MAKVSIQPYKGTRDFYPEDKRRQDYIFGVWRHVCASFGYQEYDAPMIESLDLYKLKNQESSEIVNEQVYSFTDRGGREVAVRPEMTPSVSRMVATRRQEIAYPARWYSIPNLWRYERPQRGRLREHWQLNVDIFGVDGMEAEHELITMSAMMMSEFGATKDMYSIRLNDRSIIQYCMADYLGLSEDSVAAAIKLLDRKSKMEDDVFWEQWQAICGSTPAKQVECMDKLKALLEIKHPADLPDDFGECDGPLTQLMESLVQSGVENIEFDITLMRGFGYYTGPVFEVFDTSPENNRSLFGGGRYDGLVGALGAQPVSTVGFGKGDVTISDFLDTHGLMPELPVQIDLHVVLAGDCYQAAQSMLAQLRSDGVSIAVDSSGRKLAKQIDAAVKAGASNILIIGPDELATGQYQLKSMAAGDSQTHTVQGLVEKFSH